MSTRGWIARHEGKTPDQLKAEIAYYARRLQQTRSADRRARAHRAIQAREAALTQAIKVRAGVEP